MRILRSTITKEIAKTIFKYDPDLSEEGSLELAEGIVQDLQKIVVFPSGIPYATIILKETK